MSDKIKEAKDALQSAITGFVQCEIFNATQGTENQKGLGLVNRLETVLEGDVRSKLQALLAFRTEAKEKKLPENVIDAIDVLIDTLDRAVAIEQYSDIDKEPLPTDIPGVQQAIFDLLDQCPESLSTRVIGIFRGSVRRFLAEEPSDIAKGMVFLNDAYLDMRPREVNAEDERWFHRMKRLINQCKNIVGNGQKP